MDILQILQLVQTALAPVLFALAIYASLLTIIRKSETEAIWASLFWFFFLLNWSA